LKIKLGFKLWEEMKILEVYAVLCRSAIQ
jgi:hypothetical protein